MALKNIPSFVLAFLAVCLFAAPLSAFAALSISPLKFEYTLEPGQTAEGVIRVTNTEKTPVTIYTSKADFTAGDDSGNPTFVDPKDAAVDLSGLSSWINIEAKNLTLASGESRELKFRVVAPAKADPGGHYGAVFLSPNNPSTDGQIIATSRFGVLVLVNIPGNVVTRGELSKFSVGKREGKTFTAKDTFEELPATFEAHFRNDGNTHLKPRGRIEIVDEKGEILKNIGKEVMVSPAGAYVGERMVDYLPINDAQGNVLPRSERRFDVTWEGFGYQELNADGTKSVKFKNLSAYYKNRASEEKTILKFWESAHAQQVERKFTANLVLSYEDKDRQTKEFRQSKNFNIIYEEQVIGLNYFVIVGGIIVLIALGWYIFMYVPASRERLKAQLLSEMRRSSQNTPSE